MTAFPQAVGEGCVFNREHAIELGPRVLDGDGVSTRSVLEPVAVRSRFGVDRLADGVVAGSERQRGISRRQDASRSDVLSGLHEEVVAASGVRLDLADPVGGQHLGQPSLVI
ncbi:MAG: hypothetical protein KF906_03080 [Actinobacteria bacterium]|nr:hypothetical protein [Actinomycetota bacterium]